MGPVVAAGVGMQAKASQQAAHGILESKWLRPQAPAWQVAPGI